MVATKEKVKKAAQFFILTSFAGIRGHAAFLSPAFSAYWKL
jgi:hypothetical protein